MTAPATTILGPPSIAWSGTTLYLLRSPAGSQLSAGGSSSSPPNPGAIPNPIISAYDAADNTWSTITVPGSTSVMATLEWNAGHHFYLAATPVSAWLLATQHGQDTIVSDP